MPKFRGFGEFLDWIARAKLLMDLAIWIAAAKGIRALFMTFTKIPSIWISPIEWLGGALILWIFIICAKRFHAEDRPGKKKGGDLDDLDDEIKKGLQDSWNDAKRAGAQAAMLWSFAAWARDIVAKLEETWDHWNYAGEHLIHPLNVRLDQVDYSKDASSQLVTERRDFMVEYAAHLRRIRADLRGFSSDLLRLEYPSDREYRHVLNFLRNHADKLDEEADKIWKSEMPNEDLQKEPVEEGH